jgi:hypothetical protein
MKPKVSEQDLTDYALNELGPEERIYVETYLAAAEEAREDVYAMIDLAMMLDEGFERENVGEPVKLTAEQHNAVLNVAGPNIFLRNTVIALAAAACATVAFVQRDAWMPRWQMPQTAKATSITTPGKTAKVGTQVKVTTEDTDFVNQIRQFREFTDDPLLRKWFQSLPGVNSPAPTMNTDAETFESLMP